MPIYEYECLDCKRTFEFEQRISDPALTECPRCHGELRRLIPTGGGFIIRNSGGVSQTRRSGNAGGCSLAETGTTCCGRTERCDKPPCGTGR
jgi:putative FmdB family regulatory protein